MRMKGSWHRYRPGEPWRLPARRAVCVLETDAAVAVCFDAPVVELLTDADLARHGTLRALGPDLLAESPDLDEAVRRLREREDHAAGRGAARPAGGGGDRECHQVGVAASWSAWIRGRQ